MKKFVLRAASVSAVAALAFAAVTFDSATGTGFVGKGDVQLALGLNNAQLQAQAGSLVFAATSVSESSWTCDRDAGPQTQERSRTTTTQGLVSKVDRVKNQINGFILEGYSGTPTTESEGPALNSCPSGWTSLGATTVDGPSQLTVNGVALN